MDCLNFVSYFFGGVFLCNAIPHVVSGLMGHPFQSPFATPPGLRTLLFDRQRRVGRSQFRRRLCPDLRCRRLQPALRRPCGNSGAGFSFGRLDRSVRRLNRYPLRVRSPETSYQCACSEPCRRNRSNLVVVKQQMATIRRKVVSCSRSVLTFSGHRTLCARGKARFIQSACRSAASSFVDLISETVQRRWRPRLASRGALRCVSCLSSNPPTLGLRHRSSSRR